MTQKNNKHQNRDLSTLGQAIKKIEGVTDHNEKIPESPNALKARSAIGSFTFNEKVINYIIIEAEKNKFINFRMNMEYLKKDLKEEYSERNLMMEKLNSQNNKTIGIKYFIASESEENITISANSEYIIDESMKSYGFIKLCIAILSTGFNLLSIHKQDE
ncbi:hypothetical protein [Pantoea dispersa]|uniref:hypothetical protein n=1 Tax=Pantoea dispersa TaxID=59814 RepID=UPI0007367AAB|nr:hypothetical protein [Pantoea dispersa]KTR99290.1 hypothetical protein NS375_09790 [Pantoea dispersa]